MERVTETNINTVEEWNARYSTEKGLTTTSWNCHSAVTVLSTVIPRGANVLDCATGTAFGPKNVSRRRPDIIWSGCDFSDVVLAHQRATPSVPWKQLFHCDIQKLSEAPELRGRRFTAVTAFEVLEHLEDPLAIVPQMADFAERQIIASVPYRNNIPSPDHLWSIDEEEFRSWFEPFGRVETYIVRFATDMIAVCDRG